MKTALLLSLVTLSLASPIPISGGGTYVVDSNSGYSYYNFHLSGSADDGRNVFMGGTCMGSILGCYAIYSPMGAVIDEFYFSPGFFSFSLGLGTVTGFNAQHLAILTETIDGVVTLASAVCDSPLPTHVCSGTFSIAPSLVSGESHVAPEPVTIALVGLGLVALGLARRGR